MSVEVSNNLELEQEQQSNSNYDDVEKNDNVGFELDDPATWNVGDLKLVDQIIHSNLTQNLEADFTKSERSYEKDGQTGKTVRKVSVHLFFSLLPNGETFKRDWLLYSKSTGKVFCVPCLLFHAEEQKTSMSKGFNDWKHSSDMAKKHEQSPDHREHILKYISRKKISSVQSFVLTQHENEVKYWRDVLTRVVSAVKFLAVRGLPFRGDNQQLGSTSNGLFLGCLELISEYDHFLAQHINEYGNKGKGTVSYLSADIYTEFIDIMSKQVLQEIMTEIRKARYFSLIIDSTPDVSL